jgi:hypothetical protein
MLSLDHIVLMIFLWFLVGCPSTKTLKLFALITCERFGTKTDS